MILTVCLNPTLQRSLFFNSLKIGEVNRANQQLLCASGKGVNVTRVLTQLGVPAVHLTHVSGIQKRLFINLCRKDNILLSWIPGCSEIRTCTTAVNYGDSTATELIEAADPVGKNTERLILQRYRRLIKKSTAVVISGTKTPGYSDTLYPEMVKLANALHVPAILDIKGEDLKRSLPHGPAWVKPNLAEFIETFQIGQIQSEHKIDDETLKLAIRKAQTFAKKHSTSFILTRGAMGVEVITSEFHFHMDALQIAAVNTIGCGDAFAAGFAADLPSRNNAEQIRKAVVFAQECAAKNAMTKKPGSLY